MNLLNAWDARAPHILLAIFLALFIQDAAWGATKYAAPDGSSTNSGDSARNPWDAKSCLSRLSPGDTCIYLEGNYGSANFEPANSGTRSARIVHRCESRHACVFDRLKLDGNAFLDIVNISSDSHSYDASKSYTNPRMLVRNSHDLRFDSIFVRGEPQRCAKGNPDKGCAGDSTYNRYNDLVLIGDSHKPDAVSYRIEITGASEFVNGNHSVMEIYDDGDSQYCEDNESDFWIHGTPETPIRFSNKYHHTMSFKGACRVLVEYVDFGPTGTGRADRMQPDNSDSQQAGGVLHGSTMQNVIVRYSNLTKGGSASDKSKTLSHIEVGMYGLGGINGACFAHNSHFRPWGPFAVVGLINAPSVKNVSIINNAIAEGWHMSVTNPNAVTSPFAGYLMARPGADGVFAVDIDGLAVDSASARNGLLFGRNGSRFSFQDAPFKSDGVTVGPTVFNKVNDMFRNPGSGDYRPVPGSRLIGSAAPVARTTSSGSGNTVPVDRAECFAGELRGMRGGDKIVIGNAECTVTKTNLNNGTISCSRSIAWDAGDEIFYKTNLGVMRDIGSRSLESPFVPTGSTIRPKPPTLNAN